MLNKPDLYTERRLRVADRIENSNDFDMRNWSTCICGHIWKEMGREDMFKVTSQDAASYIGLEPSAAQSLWGGRCDQKEAAKVMRHLAVTGTVDWDILKKKSLMDKVRELVV